jgi:hypothetical protein
VARIQGKTQEPRHVTIDDVVFRVDTDAEVPYRRISDSVMVPRVEISGVPGAINLQRNVWLWTMSDFAGGEGRIVFDSADPLGPPTFYKTNGGVDVRIRGQFSLHPDESLANNTTGGGSAPTVTTWVNTDMVNISGAEMAAGAAGNHVRLGAGDSARAPARTPGAGPTIIVQARFVQTHTVAGNARVSVELEIWNNTDSTTTASVTDNLIDEEKVTLTTSLLRG